MQNEAGSPGSPQFESVPLRPVGHSLPPAPPSVPSGYDWISVSHRDVDGNAIPRFVETWQQQPPGQATEYPIEHPFMREEYVHDLRQRYERQMHQLQRLEDVSRPFERRLRRLEDVRAEVVSLRLRLPTEAEHCENNRVLVSTFQDAFMQEAQAFLNDIGGEQSTDKLRLAYNQAAEVRERHDNVVQYTRDFETRLSSVEAKMQRLEEKVISTATAMSEVLRQVFPAKSGTATVVESDGPLLVDDGSSEGIPRPVERYFDKAGDVKLERDKLFDLDQEHRQEKVQRQLERDQDRLPELSDEEFEERWLRVFADAEMAFEEAKERAEKALQACKSKGLDPNDFRKDRSQLPDEAIGTPDLGGGQADTATPSSYAHGSSQAVQTPTHQLLFSPLDEPQFGEEIYAEEAPPRLGRRREKDKGWPLARFVRDWMSTVPVADQLRPRTTSEASPLLRVANFDVSPSWTSERRPSAIKTQRGSQASFNARWTEAEKDDQRPSVIKHSSSESELFIFHSQPSVRSRIFDFWQSGEIGPYGTQAEASLIQRSKSMPQAIV